MMKKLEGNPCLHLGLYYILRIQLYQISENGLAGIYIGEGSYTHERLITHKRLIL